MRFILAFIGIMVLSWLTGLVLPWWNIALVSFILAVLIRQKPFPAFVCAFLAVFILWFALSYRIDLHNDHILSARMALLIFKKESPLLIITLSAFTGGLVAGMGSLTGSLLPSGKKRSWGR